MKYKAVGAMALVLALLTVATTSAIAAFPSPDQPALLTEPAAAELPRVAIGAHRMAGTHLVPPSRGVVLAELRKQGLSLDASPEEIEAALRDFNLRFSKQSDTWVNPKFQEWVLEREAKMAAGTVGVIRVREPAISDPSKGTPGGPQDAQIREFRQLSMGTFAAARWVE